MSKVNYNGTATGATSDEVAPANASRTNFIFASRGDTFVLNFGEDATADNIMEIKANQRIEFLINDPYDISKAINVYCANASKFEAQAEEMSI